jgi:D-aspartate ligase
MEDEFDIELRKHKFIVFSQDHYNPLGVIRSLGEKGLNPISILYTQNPCIINHCRYVSELNQVNSLEDGYRLLLEKYGNEEYKPFVYCSDDTTESFLDEHYNELKEKFFFYNAGEQGRITWLQNKDNITNLAAEVGLEIPKKEVVNTGELPKSLKYPIITKVLASTMGAWKDDVFICKNEDELKEAYKKIKSPKLILQEFVQKKGEFCMEGFSINEGKDVFFPYMVDFIRYYYNSYGHYMNIFPFPDSELKSKILELFKKTRYNGIFEIEFMKGPDDEKYFLEINLRASTWNYSVTVGGGNMPYFWAKSILMGRIPYEEMTLRAEPFTAMVEPDDFINNVLKSNEVGLIQWVREFVKCDCPYYYNRKDPKPFWAYLKRRLLNRIR